MASASSGATRWASPLGTAGLVALAGGPFVAYLGITPALAGFGLFALGGLLGVIALLLGIVGAVRGGGVGRGLILGAVVTVAFFAIASRSGKFPRINDITTDTVNPPQFIRAQTLPGNQGRDMNYPGPSFATQQQAGYPDLGPLRLTVPPDQAFQRVLAAAKDMPNWEITRSDPPAHTLEGIATSALFRFKDDFVVEVRPQDGGSVVQMRSKSRDGKGDIGANAARINAFFAKLR